MALKDDLEKRVKEIFREQWSTRDGTVVPSEDSIKLSNDAVKLDATVLYADLADSTDLVAYNADFFSAEIYRTFLHCAAKIITSQGGSITAYDGDRIMAVYLGTAKNTSAVRSALKINWAAKNIIQPEMDAMYENNLYKLHHVCGVDTSDLFVARTGIRGSNDLVWVGRSANYAAKLAAMDHNKPTWITQDVYDRLHDSVKYSEGVDVWRHDNSDFLREMPIYSSTYWWSL